MTLQILPGALRNEIGQREERALIRAFGELRDNLPRAISKLPGAFAGTFDSAALPDHGENFSKGRILIMAIAQYGLSQAPFGRTRRLESVDERQRYLAF